MLGSLTIARTPSVKSSLLMLPPMPFKEDMAVARLAIEVGLNPISEWLYGRIVGLSQL